MSLCVNRSVHAKVGERVNFPGLAVTVKKISPDQVRLNRGREVITLVPGEPFPIMNDTGDQMRVKVVVLPDSRQVNISCSNLGLTH